MKDYLPSFLAGSKQPELPGKAQHALQAASEAASEAKVDHRDLPRLYCPGRLLHIQRMEGAAPAVSQGAGAGCFCGWCSLLHLACWRAVGQSPARAPSRMWCIAGGKGKGYEVREAAGPAQRFERIVLNKSMWRDHLASTYQEGLQQAIAGL